MRTRKRLISWSLMLLAMSGASLALGAPPANAGGSCHSDAIAAAGVQVTLSELCFGPTVLYVNPGATVTWTNKDDTAHTVTGLGFRWGTGADLLQGNAISYQFADKGIYPYSCIIHPGMVGAVVVGDAGSPSAAHALAAPVLVQENPQAAVAQLGARVRTVTSGFWRAVALITLGLLVALAATVALQWRQRSRDGANTVS